MNLGQNRHPQELVGSRLSLVFRRLIRDCLYLPLALAIVCGAINLHFFCYDTFDLSLALPIAKARAGLGIQDRADLLIDSGFRIPFHVYGVASFLYRLKFDVELLWYVLHCIVFSVTTACFWFLARSISNSHYVASISAVILSLSRPIYGSLNWCPIPHSSLVTAAAALPFCLIALCFAYSGRPLIGLLASAVAFNIHPYVALISIFACLACFLLENNCVQWRKIGLAFLAVLPMVPNIIAILSNLPDNFKLSDETPLTFFDQFKLYADHVYPSSHWDQGYTVFFVNLLLLAIFWGDIPAAARRVSKIILCTLCLLLLIYNLNVYFFGYKALLLTFLFRVTYFIKPIVFIAITHGMVATIRFVLCNGNGAKKFLMIFAATCWLCSSLRTLPPPVAEVAALISAASLLLLRLGSEARQFLLIPPLLMVAVYQVLAIRTSSVLEIAGQSYATLGVATLFGVLTGIVLTLVIAARPEWVRLPDGETQRRGFQGPMMVSSIVAILILLFNLGMRQLGFASEICGELHWGLVAVRQKAHLASYLPQSVEMVSWVRENTNSSGGFIVPPDATISLYFRVLTDRPVYITKFEINQLAFDSRVYYEGHLRLQSIGAKINERNQLEYDGYAKLTKEEFVDIRKRFNAGYVLFEKPLVPTGLDLPVVYEDKYFRIYSLPDVL